MNWWHEILQTRLLTEPAYHIFTTLNPTQSMGRRNWMRTSSRKNLLSTIYSFELRASVFDSCWVEAFVMDSMLNCTWWPEKLHPENILQKHVNSTVSAPSIPPALIGHHTQTVLAYRFEEIINFENFVWIFYGKAPLHNVPTAQSYRYNPQEHWNPLHHQRVVRSP